MSGLACLSRREGIFPTQRPPPRYADRTVEDAGVVYLGGLVGRVPVHVQLPGIPQGYTDQGDLPTPQHPTIRPPSPLVNPWSLANEVLQSLEL